MAGDEMSLPQLNYPKLAGQLRQYTSLKPLQFCPTRWLCEMEMLKHAGGKGNPERDNSLSVTTEYRPIKSSNKIYDDFLVEFVNNEKKNRKQELLKMQKVLLSKV